MSTIDRRTGAERRRSERSKVTIDVEWETSSGRRAGTLSDISELGCFVLSDGDVEDGESVKIFLPLSDGMKVEFAARVTNHVFEIGFAGSFVDTTSAQKEFLTNFVELHKVD
ncbi:MAG: PilZ domain-containing protein [Saprospiraceae bacterium]|nr:PilZ domain-containing protein [Pyrinomonadaceae bacterium]